MTNLVAGLMAWVVATSGLPAVATLPTVEMHPVAEIRARFCPDRPECEPLGYVGERHPDVVWLADHLDLERNIYHRSVLFHEIVHVLQATAGLTDWGVECHVGRQLELQAYQLQVRWLAEHHEYGAARMVARSVRYILPPCREG